MKMKRIFSGTAALLLMCVSSILPTCDLSCGFSAFQSDCHSPRMVTADSDGSDMNVAGMVMPEPAGDSAADQPEVSSVSPEMPAHAALMEMGSCVRQSCAQAPGLVSISLHSAAAQLERGSSPNGFGSLDLPKIAFHDARDGVSPPDRVLHVYLAMSLRI